MALLEDKPSTYQSLEQLLYTYTDGFTKEEGAYPLNSKTEKEEAEAILSKYYGYVNDANLDMDRQDDGGTVEYKIEFSDPLGNFEEENNLTEEYIDFDKHFDDSYNFAQVMTTNEFFKMLDEVIDHA